MGFLTIKSNSIYLTVDAAAKPIRPLLRQAEGVWCHSIPSCSATGPDGKPYTIRKFTMINAQFTRFMKDNPDPLWDKLDPFDRTKQDGSRVDFPLRPQHLLPVWSYADNDVKLVKQGNQFFKEMDKFCDAGGDVTACDWMCWFTGQGRRKEYQTSRRDVSPFQCSIDTNLLQTKIKAVMDQAFAELTPFKTEEELVRYVHGDNQAADSPPKEMNQTSMPGYAYGGQSQVGLGSMPMLPPMQQNFAPSGATQQYVPQMAPSTPNINMQPIPQMAPPIPNINMQPTPQNTYIPTQTNVTPSNGMPQVTWQPPVSTFTFVPPPQVWQPPTTAAPQQNWQPPTTAAPQQNWQPPVQQPQLQVPNAPVVSVPVFAPPQQVSGAQQVITPDTPLDFGKYSGKSLLWIRDNDPKYLNFLKGNKPALSSLIEQIMSQPSAPVQQQTMGQLDGAQEELRSMLVKEINEKILTIPAFQGPGVMTNLMPFLQQQIGSTNFSDAPLDRLQSLKLAVDSKLSAGA